MSIKIIYPDQCLGRRIIGVTKEIVLFSDLFVMPIVGTDVNIVGNPINATVERVSSDFIYKDNLLKFTLYIGENAEISFFIPFEQSLGNFTGRYIYSKN